MEQSEQQYAIAKAFASLPLTKTLQRSMAASFVAPDRS
jgi:hypothetical protein